MTINLTQDEQELVARGQESLAFIRSDLSYRHWLDYALGLNAGAVALQRQEGLNKRQGKRWAQHWGPWLRETGFDKIEPAVRSRLQKIIDNLPAITAWRETLTDAQRQKWNHPDTILKAWKATLPPAAKKASAKKAVVADMVEQQPPSALSAMRERAEDIVAARDAERQDAALKTSQEVVPTGFINANAPIVVGELPPKIGMSDGKKQVARDIVEKAFHPRNTVGEAIAFIRGYHRIVGAWAPSDLDIGSDRIQIATLKEDLRSQAATIITTIGDNSDLRTEVRELKEQLQTQKREHNIRVRELNDEIEKLKKRRQPKTKVNGLHDSL